MRVYDVSDPYIKELAYFIPQPLYAYFIPQPGRSCSSISSTRPHAAFTEDCVVDDRGYIYMDTWHDGMYILRMKEDNKN